MNRPLLETAALTRQFDSRPAVEDLTLSVHAGEVVSLLGPNGAGKTTTFRLMAALLPPTAGTVVVAGIRLGRSPVFPGDDGARAGAVNTAAVRERVGLLTEAPGLWERLTVRLNLQTYARLQGVRDPGRVTAVMKTVGVADRADDRAGTLSRGLRQRVALARALLHDPPVLLLDEPTSGLDPASAREVRDLIRRLREHGRAVLVSTHNLAEAEAISDRVAILRTRLLAVDTPGRLRQQASGGVVEVEVEGDASAFREIVERRGAAVEGVEAMRLRVRIGRAEAVPDLVAALVHAGARVRRVEPLASSLEEAYLALVRGDA